MPSFVDNEPVIVNPLPLISSEPVITAAPEYGKPAPPPLPNPLAAADSDMNVGEIYDAVNAYDAVVAYDADSIDPITEPEIDPVIYPMTVSEPLIVISPCEMSPFLATNSFAMFN